MFWNRYRRLVLAWGPGLGAFVQRWYFGPRRRLPFAAARLLMAVAEAPHRLGCYFSGYQYLVWAEPARREDPYDAD